MSRIKLVLLSVVAVFVVGAIGATSASAHFFAACEETTAGAGHWSNSVCSSRGGSENFTTKELASEELEGESSETAELTGTIANTKVTIGCAKTALEAKTSILETGGKSKATILYTKCALYETSTGKQNTKCEVSPITAKVNGALEGSPVEIKFEPPVVTEPFTTITIKGTSCLQKITNAPVEGSQKCELPEAWVFLRLHIIHCVAAGSHLTFDHAPATYRGLISIKIIRAIVFGAL